LNRQKLIDTAILISFLLVSCGSVQTGNSPVQVETLNQYIRALTEKNEAAYTRLICPSWESEALLEFDAYKGVQTRPGDMNCRLLNSKDSEANVNCQGKILLSYGTEQNELDLSSRIYRLTKSGDDWQVCGFSTGAQ
jgi:hypothetical protein